MGFRPSSGTRRWPSLIGSCCGINIDVNFDLSVTIWAKSNDKRTVVISLVAGGVEDVQGWGYSIRNTTQSNWCERLRVMVACCVGTVEFRR